MKPEVLLKAFVLHRSDEGFREVVASTVDQVYSSALHIVQGPPHLVEEVVLRVYWQLAREAPWLSKEVVLAGWLRKNTCKTAARVLHEQDRSVDRAIFKAEKHGSNTAKGEQAAPLGLATRIAESILLNHARRDSFWFFLPRSLWPGWIRPVHVGAGLVICALGIHIVGTIPLHKRTPMILSTQVQLTPASFGQLASTEEGAIPLTPSPSPNTNATAYQK